MKHLSRVYKIKIEPNTKCLYCDHKSRHLALCKKHYNRWYQGAPMEDNKIFQGPINREELAWAAGLWDGEGSASKSPPYILKATGQTIYYPKLQMGQVDKRNLERFQKAVGGLGHICGPVKTPTNIRYDWRVGSFEDFQAVTALLWNWLGPAKRDQIRKVFKLVIP